MDFIYRIPLIDFDTSDEHEIINNWEEIKDRIVHSSPSLSKQIKDKNYEELSVEIKLTLFKYLLRGRYRATPFGKWSAVGLGYWGNSTDKELDLSCSLIPALRPSSTQKTGTYVLAPGLEISFGMIQFYHFDYKDQKWAYCLIERNKILDQLIRHFDQVGEIDFKTYSTWFKGIEAPIIRELWNKTLKTGIVQPLGATPPTPKKNPINLKAKGKILLNSRIREKLDLLTAQSGALFSAYKRPILEKFKTLFHAKYDDRYISLDRLMLDYNLIQEALATSESTSTGSPDPKINLYSDVDEINLHTNRTNQTLPEGIQDIQYVFHLGKDEQIVLDNIVCNRPFVYSGRFSEDPEIFNLSQRLNPSPKPADSYIFCDIQIKESDTINFLTLHQNCFKHQLSATFNDVENSIPLHELFLGIHRERILLVWRKHKVAVIPVFQHPVNGQQLTLPLFRLLWEISNQDSFKFLPYVQESNQSSSYTPRYTWDSIVLQERKWVLHSDEIKDKNQLYLHLKCNAIACPVNAGVMDQELILNWEEANALSILSKELQKSGMLNLFEAAVYANSPFTSKKGNPLFPQFVYQKKVNSITPTLPAFLNYMDEQDPSCLYYRITTTPHSLIPLLKQTLPKIIQHLKATKPELCWYFLLYSAPSLEVRLRFPGLKSSELYRLQKVVSNYLNPNTSAVSIQLAPYYPEFEKYSHADIRRSEELFHWESELMLFGDAELKRPLICSSDHFKVKLISEIWSQIFHQSEEAKEYVKQLKENLKNLPVHDIRKIRVHFDRYLTPNHLPKSATNYINSIQSHVNYQQQSTQKILLLNHFHMMANRFFLMNATDFEEVSQYVTYRKLGRKIHGQN